MKIFITDSNKSLIKNSGLGLLTALFVVGFSIILADLIYRPNKIAKRGYQVEIILQSASPILLADKGLTKPKVSKEVADIAALIDNADVNVGSRIAKKCAACHTFEKGGVNKIGPNLFGIIGRKKGSLPGFSYSEAMVKKGGVWTIQDINQFITKPKDYLPGTKMAFAGLKNAKDRANVIAYLKQNK